MIKRFTSSTISEAPQGPGLYAWYSRVDIGDSDYIRHLLEDGKDLGEDRFRALLARHTQRHNLPDLNVHIRSSFDAQWKATLPELTTERFMHLLSGADAEAEEDPRAKHDLTYLARAFANQKSRFLFKRILEDSVPVFAAPIYIGVTDNLRRRLTEHMTLLQKLLRALAKSSEQEEARRVAAKSSDFAARAMAAGFEENYLEVHVQDFSDFADGQYTDEELRAIAESAEWVLNRWHKPYLGRR